jgi:hypothetical protein
MVVDRAEKKLLPLVRDDAHGGKLGSSSLRGRGPRQVALALLFSATSQSQSAAHGLELPAGGAGGGSARGELRGVLGALASGWPADFTLPGPDPWKPPSPAFPWNPPAPWDAAEPWEAPDPWEPPELPEPLASMRGRAAVALGVLSPGSPLARSVEAGADMTLTDPRRAVASSSDFTACSSFAEPSQTRPMVQAGGRLSNEVATGIAAPSELDDRFAHEHERDAARLASMLHSDHSPGGADVASGRNLFAVTGGTPTLACLGQLGLGRRHGAAS